MNNNKKNNKVLLIIFIFALYVPTITFFFIKNNINYDNNEKRKLAEKPTLSLSKIQSYPKEFDLYYNDNLPYRNYIIKNWRTMNYLIFNEAIDERVLIGKNELNEPWLFYDNKKDDEISYINGKKTVDEKKINNIANVIKLQTKKLKDKDIDLYYIIAPNKSSVYSEYLPKNVEVKDDYFEKAYKLIKNKGITNVYYDLNILKESKKNFETYYRTDTHWNDYGTYIYIKNILNKIYKKNLFLNEKISQEVVDSNSGDLHTFLGVSVNIKDTQTNVDFSNKADHPLIILRILVNHKFFHRL